MISLLYETVSIISAERSECFSYKIIKFFCMRMTNVTPNFCFRAYTPSLLWSVRFTAEMTKNK